MSVRKLLALSVFAIVMFSALYIGVATREPGGAADSNSRPAPPPYGARGAHDVGIRNLIIDGRKPLAIGVWYPSLNAGSPEQTTEYRYEVKMGPPLGNVAIAKYGRQAFGDAAYDLSAGPYPLVILSSGFAMGSNTYAWLAEHLASHGFVVIAPEHSEHMDPANELWRAAITRPRDVLSVLAYVDAAVEPGGHLEGVVNPDLVAVVGHSYGGYTALAAGGARLDTAGFEAHCANAYESAEPAAWLCDELLPHMGDMASLAGLDSVPENLWPTWADSRVDAVVPMAGDAFFFGEKGLAEINVPVMAMGGTTDSDSPFMWGTHPTYEHSASSRKVKIAFDDAEHMIFTARCESIVWYASILSSEFCSDSTWDRKRAHDLVKHFTTAFLLAELKEDTRAAAALLPDAVDFPSVAYEAQGYRAR